MKELVSKLPEPANANHQGVQKREDRDPNISDATIGAVLGILWEAVRYSVDLTQSIHETLDGTERLQTLAKSYPIYGMRICKYATQVYLFIYK